MQTFEDNCKKCSLCHLIDLNNLPSLRIIEPDGNNIKKDQILDLKYLFSKDSLYTKENIYIIKYAEKMNKEAANTMLKFLEEPDGSIIGFFLTNQKDNIMPTIQSRCQILEVNFDNDIYEELDIDNETYEKYKNILQDYLAKIELEKTDLILYNRTYLSDLEKEALKKIFQLSLKIYKDTLEKKYLNQEINQDYSFLQNLDVNNLKAKVNEIIEILKEINYNVNMDMLLDKFILKMEEINNECV